MTIAPLALLSQILCAAVTTGPAASLPAGYEGQTRKVLERALQAYTSAQSYHDHLIMKPEAEFEGDASDIIPPVGQEIDVSFAQPNKISFRTDALALVCNGKTLWQELKPIEQYIESPAPPKLLVTELDINNIMLFRRAYHPIATILLKPDPGPGDFLRGITGFTATRTETRGGKQVSIVSGNMQSDSPSPTPFEMVFRNDDGLLTDIEVDQTQYVQRSLQQAGATVTVKRAVQTLRFRDIRLNTKLGEDVFTYKPGKYEDKVAAFEPPTDPNALQMRLVGRPAPDFSAADFDGKTVKLADFRGRVLVLDFWTTWCQPCLYAMPRMQKLYEGFAGKAVTFLGVNGDRVPPAPASQPAGVASASTSPSTTVPEASTQPATARFEKIKAVLRRLGVTYPQISEFGAGISEEYRVGGIPNLVLVDQKGIIRAIYPGYAQGLEELLQKQIEALLSGKEMPKALSAPATAPAMVPMTPPQ